MRFEIGSLPFGVAPAILKDCAQQLRRREAAFTFDEFCEALGAPRKEAAPVLAQLVEQGYLLLEPDGVNHLPTAKFQQLALATVGPGIHRRDAENLLARILSKAEQINAAPDEFPCGVIAIGVFGSFLTDKAVLGDLDIAVDVAKVRVPQGQGLLRNAIRVIDQSQSATRKTLSTLRLRKPNLISIHTFEEVKHLGTPFKVVFGALAARQPLG